MGILTKLQITDEIKANLGKRTDLDTRMDIIIDLAQTRIARKHKFLELNVVRTSDILTIDDKFFIIPTTDEVRKMYSIRLITGDGRSLKLEKVLPANWDLAIPEPEFYSIGRPTHYTMWEGNRIELWRIPDIAYSIHLRYSKWPTLATSLSDSDKLDFDRMDDIVIMLATSWSWHSLGRRDKGREYFGFYSAMLKEATDEEDTDDDLVIAGSKVNELRGTRGYDDPFVRMID